MSLKIRQITDLFAKIVKIPQHSASDLNSVTCLF